jgi:hypothetical protein
MPRLRLFHDELARICPAMRTLPILAALLSLSVSATAAENTKPSRHPKSGPQAIGTFEDWTAATSQEGGQTVCYAFTRARSSSPALHGRGEVVLTIAERPSGRDAVAISGGYSFPANATVRFEVDHTAFEFYTAQRSAFARDGHAVAEAMLRGREATSRAPTPKKGPEVVDTFSLKGFAQAYAAIVKRCPAGKGSA